MARAVLCFAAAALCSVSEGDDMKSRWTAWKHKYGMSYNGDESKRFEVFQSNANFVDAENAKKSSFTLELNAFAHLTNEEFIAGFTGARGRRQDDLERVWLGAAQVSEDIPAAVDWRNHTGILQPIKNQGSCASCWAFSAISAVESNVALASGKSVSLSEQQLIDCDNDCFNCTANPENPEHRNGGCAGGWSTWAFNWMQNASICTEDSYPYKGTDPQTNLNICAAGCDVSVAQGVVKGYMTVNKSYVALKEALSQRPVAIEVAADSWWQFYSGGVLDGSGGCAGSVNHAVNAVGYAPSTDSRYDNEYVVRNSWGADWGENGYVRIPSIYHYAPQDDIDHFSPSCMLLNKPTFPSIDTSFTVAV